MSTLPTFTRRQYFDVVRLWTARDEAHEGSLAPLCRALRIYHPPRRRPFGPDADTILQLHQPTREALEVLTLLARHRMAVINKVEVALDLLTDSAEDAQALWEYLDRHLVQRWHGADPVTYKCGTRYTRLPRWGQRQLVMYADDKAAAKHGGQPACHLELRASSAGHVRRLGLDSPDKLSALDHDAFWRRFLILERPNVQMIGRQARGRSRAKKPDVRRCYVGDRTYDADVRVGRAFVRAAARADAGASAQDVCDELRNAPWFRRATAVQRLDSEPFVPAAATPLIKVPKAGFPSPTGSASGSPGIAQDKESKA